MAARGHERFAQRQPLRPSIQSQHSNSVPSTPYQQPHDLRFHSRSPSPRRGLGNQSPRSLASEAVDAGAPNGVQRGLPAAPVVCKFETAPEWRKRRIPYVDGGDEELGRPQKEPKFRLERDEEDRLSGDMRELYDRLLPSDESEQRRAQLVRKLERILNEEWPGHDIKVSIFGSSGNLLSSSDSDVDICVTTSLKKVESMHTLAMLLHKNGMERVVCRAAAKVPIVKCWDPALELACDVNVNNPLALENTRMIKTYVQLDPRVRPLAKIIKYWTKRRILNDAAFGGTISSYTWICMIISFLQRRNPPILPSLQKMPDAKRSVVDGNQSEFADDLQSLQGFGDVNKESLAELLFYFFRHYGYEFEYSKFVVSVKEGRPLSRKEKGWDNYADNKEARCRLCVEEPFNTLRNLGNSADDYAWSGIHGEIRRAFDLLADGVQLEKCCEQYEFPPEEKPIFQRPAPKPKPTLTRSASQSGGRPNHDPGSTRSRKGASRNPSTQRSNNRRASSGAVFGSQRLPFVNSPPVGIHPLDYFATKGNLHDQLFQQYQYLQAQQDALRSQLAAQQQQQQNKAHTQGQSPAQSRVGDSGTANSPHHRHQTPRFFEGVPATAPLLPGYLYHYPARYPPPSSPLLQQQQQRTRDGSSTNPSSPSLVAAVPISARLPNRASVPEGSSSTMRSQSQPGRSLPHPITLQQQVHPGYDVSGALGGAYQNLRPTQPFPHSFAAGLQLPIPTLPGLHPNASTASAETAMPKEYVGYYVGQSPQVASQYANVTHMQVQPMPALRDPPPHRQRRVTPELMPMAPNGTHASRSPSPLGHPRSYSTAGDPNPSCAEGISQSAASLHESPTAAAVTYPSQSSSAEPDNGAPIIVNGSNPPTASKSQDRVNGVPANPVAQTNGDHVTDHEPFHLVQSLATRTNGSPLTGNEAFHERPPSPPITIVKSIPRLSLSSEASSQRIGDPLEPHQESKIIATAPLLSPVAELRTPSPTRSKRFESSFESPHHAHINGLVKVANTVPAQVAERENHLPRVTTDPSVLKHERKGSAPTPTTNTANSAISPMMPTPQSAVLPSPIDKNPWRQAPGRKSHKKNKSTANATGNQRSPILEAERKGG